MNLDILKKLVSPLVVLYVYVMMRAL